MNRKNDLNSVSTVHEFTFYVSHLIWKKRYNDVSQPQNCCKANVKVENVKMIAEVKRCICMLFVQTTQFFVG